MNPGLVRLMVRVVLLLALLLLPAAAAQMISPRWSLELETDKPSVVADPGTDVSANVTVRVSLSSVICPVEAIVVLTLAENHFGSGLTVALPAEVEVRFPPSLSPQGTGTEAATVEVIATVDKAAPHGDYGYTLTATAPASVPSGCVGTIPSPQEERATLNLHVRTRQPPADTSPSTSGQAKGTSALPLAFTSLALIAAARRR